jgi:hypothetical protein
MNNLHNPFGDVRYLWEYAPAMDSLQLEKNEGSNYEEDITPAINVQFIASGDLRNVVKTNLSGDLTGDKAWIQLKEQKETGHPIQNEQNGLEDNNFGYMYMIRTFPKNQQRMDTLLARTRRRNSQSIQPLSLLFIPGLDVNFIARSPSL